MVAPFDSTPRDDEAERCLLGCALLDPGETARRVVASVNAIEFHDHRAIRLFDHIRTLVHAGAAPDRKIVYEKIAATNGHAEEDGAYLGACLSSVVGPENADHYLGRVREAARRRDLYELGERIAEGIEMRLPAKIIAADAKQRLEAHRKESEAGTWGWTRAEDLLNEPEDDKSGHLWRDVLAPGVVTLVAGSPKAGKSTIIDGCAAAHERCEPWLDEPPKGEPLPFVLVSEEGRKTLRNRMRRMGMKGLIVLPRGGRPAGASWQSIVEEGERVAVKEGARCLVFDTLRGLAGFQGEDEYKPGPSIAVAQPALDAADRSQLSIVLVHHRKKPQGKGEASNIDAVSGSNALTGAVDVVVGITHTAGDDDPRRTLSFSGRLDVRSAFVVKCLTDGVWRYEYEGPLVEVANEAVDAGILGFLSSIQGFASKEEIALAVGGRRNTVKARVDALSRRVPRVLLTVKPQGKRYPLYGDVDRDPRLADEWGKLPPK